MTSIFHRTGIFAGAGDDDSDLRADDHARLFAPPALQSLPTPYLNQAPTGSVVIVGTQSVGNMLLANTQGLADGDGLGTFHYQWQTDSDVNSGWTDVGNDSPIYNLMAIDAGLNARVIVSYTDGHGTTEQVVSAPTDFIGDNNSDLNGGLGIIGTLVEGQTITADTSKLSDADGLGAFTYIWNVEGVNNFMGPTLTLTPFMATHAVTLNVFYIDGLGNGEGTSVNLGPVANINQAPVVSGPLLFGIPKVGVTLQPNTSNFSDGDGLPITIHYQWQRDGGSGFANVGTDSLNYTVSNADVGAHLRVIISYVDRAGTAEQLTSEASATVIAGNTPHTGGISITGSDVAGQTLTAVTAGLADADGLGTLHYEWIRHGGMVGADSPTYLLTTDDIGEQIGLQVTFTDQYGSPEVAFSDETAAIANAPGAVLGSSPFGAAIYNEQAAAMLFNGTVAVSDAQSATIAGATVAITNGFVAGDTLGFSNQNGITGAYDAGTHVLTLSGTASLANYQAALRAVTFFSASDNPTNFDASQIRTVSYQIDDGQASNHASNVVTTKVIIAPVNDAPTVKADTFATSATAVLTGNVFADNGAGADNDPDNVLTVTAATGGNIGHPVALQSGQTLTVNADGSFSFDPGHTYDSRPGPGSGAANIQAAFHFTYQINGGGAVVTINVTGVDSDDTLTGTSGNDTFNGGIGTNTLVFTGNHGDYAISTSGAITTFVDQRAGSPDGTDTAQNIQLYQFADGTFTRDSGTGILTHSVTDSAGTAPWASQTLLFDAQGSLTSQTIVNDGGSREVNTFNAGAALWSTDTYDGANHLLSTVATHNDGSHVLMLFDAANQYSWASAEVDFDANWNVTGVSGTRDSGSVPVTMKDIAPALDTATWSTAPADADQGAAAANTLLGGGNRDVLFGFAGADTLNGMGGNDYLDGGKGNDMLTGGAGADRFVFVTGDGNDTITDFTHGSDVIDLHGYGVTDFATLETLMYQDGANLLIALDAQNHITLQGVTIAQLSAGDFAFS
jgi:Ca2+-binding RTX toxin-like protein